MRTGFGDKVRVGIDAHILGKNKGGVERYVNNLVELLPKLAPLNKYIVFVTKKWKPALHSPNNVFYCTLPVADPLVQRSLILPILSKYFSLDLLHVQRICPLFYHGKIIVTIHDLVQERFPHRYKDFRNRLVRLLTPVTVKKASRILTVSKTEREAILTTFKLPASKVVAVYNGIDHELFSPKSGNRLNDVRRDEFSPYLLYIGAIEPRKNLEVVLKAFKLFVDSANYDVKFLMAGAVRDRNYFKDLFSLIRTLAIEDRVRHIDYVTDEECSDLMRKARLFIAPSVYEGFDLPPLEAMACGTPVLCSDIGVHREILSGAAVFFDPASPEMLYMKLRKIWNAPEIMQRLQKSGVELAERFTWEKTVWEIAQVYSEIGKDRKP